MKKQKKRQLKIVVKEEKIKDLKKKLNKFGI
jgi:hypothetical protein